MFMKSETVIQGAKITTIAIAGGGVYSVALAYKRKVKAIIGVG